MDDRRIGLVLDGRYRIEKRIAAGGMGLVYRGERLGLAKPVAIKFLHRSSALLPEKLERFQREAAAMSRLMHPNLVNIIDFGESERVPYLVMDFHPGVSLDRLLHDGPLEPRRAVFITYQILAGLGAAHARGVVHRDLKPGNILLTGNPGEDLVKILDFGVAKLLDSGEGPSELSQASGYVLGTPEYMAPEQAMAQRVDERTDLYAVGVILYEMVTGRRPFEGSSALAVLRQQVEDHPTPPRAHVSTISAELETAILKALAKEPEERWTSTTALAATLAALPEGSGLVPLRTEGAGGSTAHLPALVESSRRPRRRLLLLALLLVICSGGAVAAATLGLVEVPWLSRALGRTPAARARRPSFPAPPPPPDAAPPDAAPPDAAPPSPMILGDGGLPPGDAGTPPAASPDASSASSSASSTKDAGAAPLPADAGLQ